MNQSIWGSGDVEVMGRRLRPQESWFPQLAAQGNSSVPVSAPSLFAVAFNLIKPYMREETCRKVVILGGE